MVSCRVLLSAVTLTLLAVAVDSWSDGNLSGAELTRLYNSPVRYAERMFRPKGSITSGSGSGSGSVLSRLFALFDSRLPRILSHSGVRVTLVEDNSQWLIHKGKGLSEASNTVITRADQMSSRWWWEETRDFGGRKTVADFVEVGGAVYNFANANCHIASRAMMDQMVF